MTKSINVLAVNAGSSSIKLVAFNCLKNSSPDKLMSLALSGIGQGSAKLDIQKVAGSEQSLDVSANTQTDGQAIMFEHLFEALDGQPIETIAHRIVHGGQHYTDSVVITQQVIDDLEQLAEYDPEHMPASLSLIRAFQDRFPNTPQIACFDTGFFHELPKTTQLLPLPRRYYDEGLRKYGFHGLSYRYILGQLRARSGNGASGRVVIAHLGSGASLAAVKDGHPVDTTMSFSPASGIPMSSRSGDLDPGIVNYLSRKYTLSSEDFNRLVHSESGLLGISNLSANMHTLLQEQAQNPAAAEAVEVFCYSVKKAVASLAATMGGIETLVFSGGIGEQSAEIRQRICKDLAFIGVELDEFANTKQAEIISDSLSGVKVYIIPTNEALIMAQDTQRLMEE